MEILDGRKHFYQWDSDVYLTDDTFIEGQEIHFSNAALTSALVVKAKQMDSQIVAEVPNNLLQIATPIRAYYYIQDNLGNRTIIEATFPVKQKPKPDDYVYTPTEVWKYETLEKRVAKLEKGGGGGSGESIIVDQNYNAESENAQSGKAVAQAIGTVVDATNKALSSQNEVITSVKSQVSGLATSKQDNLVFDGEYNAVSNKVATVHTVAEKIAEIISSAPEDFDTLKEVADYIASDKTGAAEINNKLSQHGTRISANEMDIAENTSRIDEINDTIFGGADDSLASQGLSYEYRDDYNGYSVTGIGTCTDTDLIIPSEYQGLPVVGISDYAFYAPSGYPTTISSVFVPKTVTQGMYYAFPPGTTVYFEAKSESPYWYTYWNDAYNVFWGVSLNSEAIVNRVSAVSAGLSALTERVDTAEKNIADSSNITNGSGESSLQQIGCTTTGKNSFAEGNKTSAPGNSAHSEGRETEARGYYSHAEGRSTVARTRSQHVDGEYNRLDPKWAADARGKYVHITGNGTNGAASNAYTLDWAGNAWFAGNVYVGGEDMDDGAATLQATADSRLKTGNKEIVGAINEVNGKTVDKIISISAGVDGFAELNDDSIGICWHEFFGIALSSGAVVSGDIMQRVPIVPGKNVTFENDYENGVVKINASGGSSGLPAEYFPLLAQALGAPLYLDRYDATLYPLSCYADVDGIFTGEMFDDLCEITVTSNSSLFDLTIHNDTMFYLYIYVYVTWEEGNGERYQYVSQIIPPNQSGSIIVYGTQEMVVDSSWQYNIDGARFALNDWY